MKTTKKEILSSVSTEYGLSGYSEMYQKTRKLELREPRQLCMTLLRIMLDLTWSECGLEFMLTHATAIHSRKVWRDFYVTDKKKRVTLRNVLSRLTESPDVVISKLLTDDRYTLIAKRSKI